MKIFEILKNNKRLLTEAKARIDHPEDLLFDEGIEGARRAIDALMHIPTNPLSTTVKWDGSPAIIFGRDENGFVFTDKSGFSAKKYDGMARGQKMFQDMIYNRKPDEPNRMDYATSLGKLYPMLEKLVPVNFKGYIQGDIMWMNTPVAHDGVISIKPLKVNYNINASSELGRKILKSHAGIVVHSMFNSRDDEEPAAVENVASLGLKNVTGLVVLSPEMRITTPLSMPWEEHEAAETYLASKGAMVSKFLDPYTTGALKISNLPEIFKSYLNNMAGRGDRDFKGAPQGFVDWVQSDLSKLSPNKQANIMQHITVNQPGYKAVWHIVNAIVNLKMSLKAQLDAPQPYMDKDGVVVDDPNHVSADIRGERGHEGFVSSTPHGKIKLVDRPVFMRKA